MNGKRTTRSPSVGRLSTWVLRYTLRRWPNLLAVLGLIVLKVFFDALRPWPMKILVDNVLRHRPLPARLHAHLDWIPGAADPGNLLMICVGATVVVFLLGRSLATVSALAGISLGRRLSFDLAADLLAHMQRLSFRYHSRKAVGDSIRRVNNDTGCISAIVKGAMLPLVTSLLTLGAMFGLLWRLNPTLTCCALGVVPLILLVFRRYAELMMQASCREQEADARVYTVVERTLTAIPVVQAFTMEDRTEQQFRQAAKTSLSTALEATRVQLQFKFLIGLSTAAGTSMILWIGAHEALAGRLTVGSILVFISYLSSLYGPLEALAYTSSAVQGAAGSARRVLEVLDAEPDVKDCANPVSLARPRGEVRFDNVTFGYDEGRPVLADVNLHATPGQVVAIVGPSGAGKSTLVSLIPRFCDVWSGRVSIDGADVREIRLKDLRHHVSLVLQTPFLFPISIAQNIAYGRPDASLSEIEAAASAANAHEFIMRLPEGYDTIVGERGASLSGGERQRIAIARALLKDSPILILDEPTSAVDSATEQALVEALRKLIQGRTTLIIAHRLSTIREADQIIVLQAGRIVERGTHEALRRQSGLYAHLCELQFGSTASELGGK